MNFRTDVDSGRLALAKEETLQILELRYAQLRAAAAGKKRNKIKFELVKSLAVVLTALLIPLSFFGLVFGILDGEFPLFYSVTLPLAIAFLIFFLSWDLNKYFGTQPTKLLRAAHRKFTQSAFNAASAEVPYEAQYRLDGGLIDHFRDERLAWSLEMPRFAYLGGHVALLFKKEGSYYPKIILVHNDGEAIEQGLTSYGVEVIRV